jgi:hypothetical protein
MFIVSLLIAKTIIDGLFQHKMSLEEKVIMNSIYFHLFLDRISISFLCNKQCIKDTNEREQKES